MNHFASSANCSFPGPGPPTREVHAVSSKQQTAVPPVPPPGSSKESLLDSKESRRYGFLLVVIGAVLMSLRLSLRSVLLFALIHPTSGKAYSPKFGCKILHRSPARCAMLPSKRRRLASAGGARRASGRGYRPPVRRCRCLALGSHSATPLSSQLFYVLVYLIKRSP
jgi:hypothetical protein